MTKLYRSSKDRVLVGICGGVAEYLNVDVTLVRIIWILFSFFGGYGLIAYILGLFFIPEEPGTQFTYHPRDIIPGKESSWSYVFLGLIILFILRGIPLFHGILGFFFWGSGHLLVLLLIAGALYWAFVIRREQSASHLADWHISTEDKWLLGVCAGIGESLSIDANLVRLFWVIGSLLAPILGVLIYGILYLVISKKIRIK